MISYVFVIALTCASIDSPQIPMIQVPGREKCSIAIATLPVTTKRVELKVRDHGSIAALAARCPELEELVLLYPGSKMDNKNFVPLAKFKKLRRLVIRSDLFLSDEMFATLGKLKALRSLRLSLP